jgi:hypothetical protein
MAIKYSSIGGGSGTGFNVQIGSKYSYATFTAAQPAGAYTIKSSNNYTNWDVYLLDASNNLVAYTGSASVAPTTAFSAIVVVNGTVNDILQFSFQSTVFSTAENDKTKAGPFITAFGSSVIPSANSSVTITGGNFAVGITATFTGTDSVVRTCKSVVYTSTTSISVVRPDVLPIAYAPYVLTLTNPGINNPATSGANILTGLTVGNAPVWSTGTSLAAASNGSAYSATVVATDVEGAVTYSYVSGTLPTGLSFNAGTGVISGTYSAFTDGTASYTIRATDNGGNFTDRTFTIAYTGIGGGTLTSDATYYYRVFTSNGTLTGASGLTADILSIAGGGAGGTDQGGGGGAGGVIYAAATTLSSSSLTVTVGGGGASAVANSGTHSGNNTVFNGWTSIGGGGGSGVTYGQKAGQNGGSGGGGAPNWVGSNGAGGSATQTSGTGYIGYGNAGGTGSPGASTSCGGGGGGSSAVGATSSNTVSGSGGSGLTTWSSWLSSIASVMTGVSGWGTATSGGAIAGGGGGGTYNGSSAGAGGAGGGAQGGGPNTGGPTYSAVQCTGSGGGGGVGSSTYLAGNGGSGIVIVRYTRASVGG